MNAAARTKSGEHSWRDKAINNFYSCAFHYKVEALRLFCPESFFVTQLSQFENRLAGVAKRLMPTE